MALGGDFFDHCNLLPHHGRTDTALKIGAIEFFAKIAVYYLHERMWLRIPFGKNTVVKTPEFEI